MRTESLSSARVNRDGQRTDWPRRVGEEEFPGLVTEFPGLARKLVYNRESHQLFLETMAEKFNRPIRCPGEECDGYIYTWGFSNRNWDEDGFIPKLCNCPKGQAILEKQGQVREALRREEAEMNFQTRLAKFKLPARLTRLSLDSYRQTENGHETWLTYVDDWLASWPQCYTGLVLAGDMGRGKTGVAVGAACQLVRQDGDLTVYFANVAGLITELSGCWGRRDGSDARLVKRLKQVGLLILDDLGAGHKWVDGEERSPVRYLYEILDERYNNARPLIITTNCKTEPELTRVVGERNMNRIMDFCKFLNVTGQNLRRGI